MLELYRSPQRSRVHNVCIPATRNRDWVRGLWSYSYVVESTDISRLVGVLIRNEMRFDLLRLELIEGSWKVGKRSEICRVERSNDAELPYTSVCCSGERVLCTVEDTYRVFAFQHYELDPVGDFRFDTQLSHMTAPESPSGPLVAISFRDDFIQLYRHDQVDATGKKIFELHELVRVHCDNVHAILAVRDRLLVAERLEDEERDIIWSCSLIDDSLLLEGEVTMEHQIGVQCWRTSIDGQYIAAVGKGSQELLVLTCEPLLLIIRELSYVI